MIELCMQVQVRRINLTLSSELTVPRGKAQVKTSGVGSGCSE